jgi:hypothetical protein
VFDEPDRPTLWLMPWETADLAAQFPELVKGEAEGVQHGMSMEEAMKNASDYRWLTAAILAGYAPDDDELRLALRAKHLFLERLMGDGLEGDALAIAASAIIEYQQIIKEAERCMAETKRHMSRIEGNDVPT